MTYPLSDSFCTRFKIPKPFLPYYPGQQFTVVSHDPPEPTTYRCNLNIHTARERESKHPLERCILHPPLPGSIGVTTVYLRIVESVRLGDNHSAQVAKVQVERVIPHESSSPPVDTPLIAKFYDPLYFDHEQDDVDPFLCVDRHYSHEVAAYNALSDLQGSTIPRYYGSYSLELPAEATVRSVRLILMEFIPGASMRQLNPCDFSQLQRQVIMKAIVDAESLVYTHNVRHRDIHPRNILVLNTATAPYERRVVVIDFGIADIGRSPVPGDPESDAKYLPGVPISPLLRWNVAWWPYFFQPCFSEWIDWDWQSWLERNYGTIDPSSMGHMISIWLPSWITKPLPPPPTGDSDEHSCDSDDYSELPRFSVKNIVDNPG
ncbi:hypothetical protein V1525DRAFT_397871 [Lipomyces kononenkoae]|uniref:Uncharacterized protein n=1 Tax=Lipomyces kononenkoae TaxID=34357 RepID=A0ACC3T6M7_LIPKO